MNEFFLSLFQTLFNHSCIIELELFLIRNLSSYFALSMMLADKDKIHCNIVDFKFLINISSHFLNQVYNVFVDVDIAHSRTYCKKKNVFCFIKGNTLTFNLFVSQQVISSCSTTVWKIYPKQEQAKALCQQHNDHDGVAYISLTLSVNLLEALGH